MKFRVLVGSLLVWGSLPGCSMTGWAMSDCSKLDCSMSDCSMSDCSKPDCSKPDCSMSDCSMPGLGTLALSGSKSSCAFSPSLAHSKKIEESPTFQEKKGDRKEDAEQLARALDYFSSEKFHECLVLLQPLNRRYKLNPRYRAYLAVCLYYEWEYAEAIRLFDEVIPLLQGVAPHELSLYYWMDAESYFALQQYARALPLYEKMLPLCRDNEKPDAYYRMGFCHFFAAEVSEASSSEKASGSSESSEASSSEKVSGSSESSGASSSEKVSGSSESLGASSSEKVSGSSESSGSSAAERKKAKECFELSLEGYLKYRNTPNEQARIAQIRHMIGGLK